MVYLKEKHILLHLHNVSKEELRTYAIKENRTVNSLINVAISKYIEEKAKK